MLTRRSLTSSAAISALLMLGLGACNEAAPADQAPNRTAESAIVGGQLEAGWPGVGALTAFAPGFGYTGSFCTGTLITNEWVLTAAHCVTGQSNGFSPTPDTTYFYLGGDARPVSFNGPGTGTLYATDLFFVHPQYDDVSLENDIALVHLTNPIPGATTYPINTAFLSSNAVGATPTYVGYGATEGINSTGSGLKRSNINPLPIDWVYAQVFTSNFAGSGTCFGDSGGPAFLGVNGTTAVVGVNSAVSGCDPSVPGCNPDPCQGTGIATRVDVYASWVNSVIGGALPDCNSDPGICFCASACQPDGSCDNSACQTDTCEDIYSCFNGCPNGDQACYQTCYAAGNDQAKADVDALQVCLVNNCDGLQDDAYQNCAYSLCASEISTCFPAGVGPATCEQILTCAQACPAGDGTCLDACFSNGTATAQAQYNGMQMCFANNCSGLDGDAFTTCANNNCGAEINACLPVQSGTDTCAEIQDCFGGCASGDQACVNACFQAGSQLAQSQNNAMQGCLANACSGLSDDAFLTCAYANCSDEIEGCYPPANCNIAGGDCPSGTACYPTGTGSTDCYGSLGGSEGSACTQGPTELACADGLVCLESTCQAMCGVDPDCGPGLVCNKPLFSDNNSIGVCGCTDNDGDSYCAQDDCNDEDPNVYPGATEICGDGIDQDCLAGDESCAPDTTPDSASDTGGPVDAGPTDTGTPDAGPSDASVPDAITPDASVPDNGPDAAGPADASSETGMPQPDASADGTSTADNGGPGADVSGSGDATANADTPVFFGTGGSRSGVGCSSAPSDDAPLGMLMSVAMLLGLALTRRRS